MVRSPWKDKRDQAQHAANCVDALNRAFQRLVWMEELDEQVIGIRPVRPVLKAERRGIERLFRTYAQVTQRFYPGYDMHEIEQLLSALDWSYAGTEAQRIEQDGSPADNVLYDEFCEQQQIESFAFFAVYVSMKAVIHLLTEHKRSVSDMFGEIPTRQAAIAFVQQIDYDPNDPEWFVAHALLEVPGIWQAAQTLQKMYGNIVRVERAMQEIDDTSELPDDPGAEVTWPMEIEEDIRLEIAGVAYANGKGPVDEIATLYGIPQKKFRQYLKSLGLTLPRGGDRRG